MTLCLLPAGAPVGRRSWVVVGRCPAAVALLLVFLLPNALAAMTPAELVDDEFQREQISLTSLHDGTLSYFDSQRRLQQADVRQFVQLRAIGGREAELPAGAAVAEMTDGQRFVGRWAGGANDGETLRWQHAELGVLSLPVDRLRAVRFRTLDDEQGQAVAPGPTPAQDTVTLVNGDRLRGFVLELTEAAVVLMPETGDEPWTLPHERVALLRLANPDEPPAVGRQVMTLTDGSRVAVAGLAIRREQVRFEAPLREARGPDEMGIEQLAGVTFTAHGRRLVPLADQPMSVIEGGSVFGLPTPPRTLGRSLRLHAPVTVRFDVPESATRFAAVAELAADDADAPSHLTEWADFELVVHHGGGEQRYRLNRSQRQVAINLPVEAGMLRLELVPGVNGPILDRLRLRDAMLLIHEPAEPSSAAETDL